jgi:IS1 family transposase
VWLAVDRKRNKILDFTVTTTRSIRDYRKFVNKILNRYKIKVLCTDGNFAYQKIQISNKHIISKAETVWLKAKTLLYEEDWLDLIVVLLDIQRLLI